MSRRRWQYRLKFVWGYILIFVGFPLLMITLLSVVFSSCVPSEGPNDRQVLKGAKFDSDPKYFKPE